MGYYKIILESYHYKSLNAIRDHIISDYSTRPFIDSNDLIKIGLVSTVDVKSKKSILEVSVKDGMSMVMIPTFFDRSIVKYKLKHNIDITLVLPAENVKDIYNMIYDQIVDHKDFVDHNIVLITNENNVKVLVSKDSTKVPLFIFERFYSLFN